MFEHVIPSCAEREWKFHAAACDDDSICHRCGYGNYMQLLCTIPHPRRHPRWENSCTSRTGLSWGVGGWRHIYTYVLYIWTDTHISYICFYQHHPQSLLTHTRSHPSCPASGNTADQVRPSKCPRLANHREEQRVGRSCRLHGQILFMKLLFRNNHQPRNVKYTITMKS